jgi:acetylornithine deacetylase/succinyl-diaminopimelate desuccinylase-like protein
MHRPAALISLLLPVVAGAAAPPAAPAPEAVRAEARELFAKVISYETSIGKGQVPKLAEYLAGRFRAAGFPADDVHVLPLGETASLVVRYRGNGRGGRPVAFLAHLDVVTAKRSDWKRDPYTLTEEHGYFFGRGTSDVKQEVALLTETFLRLKAEGFVPSRDLIIAFSGDEETAQATADDLVRHHRELVDAEFALNGDGGGGVLDETTGKPTLFFVQGAEKYSVSFSMTVRNPGGHSSQPRADNAIYELADALKAVQGYQFPVRHNDWTLGDLRATSRVTDGPLGEALKRFVADPNDAAAAAEISRYPQHVGKLRTTCVATMLQGGHAENALPQSATATINCRVFPGTPVAEVQQTLKRLGGPQVEVTMNYEPTTSEASPLRADVMALVTRAVNAANPGAEIVPTQAAYATDGLVFRNGGIPTYGVGSTFEKGSEEFAHGLDERIPVASFYAGLTHWYVLIKSLAGRH